MEFTIQRKYLLGLGNWLNTLSLSGQESRNRTKFVEELAEEVNENEATRKEILKKYADLDEKGELKLVENEKGVSSYHVPDEKMAEFQKEFIDFLDSDITFGGPGMKTRLEIVKNIVLNTETKIDGSIASDYSAWADAFEAIKE